MGCNCSSKSVKKTSARQVVKKTMANTVNEKPKRDVRKIVKRPAR